MASSPWKLLSDPPGTRPSNGFGDVTGLSGEAEGPFFAAEAKISA